MACHNEAQQPAAGKDGKVADYALSRRIVGSGGRFVEAKKNEDKNN